MEVFTNHVDLNTPIGTFSLHYCQHPFLIREIRLPNVPTGIVHPFLPHETALEHTSAPPAALRVIEEIARYLAGHSIGSDWPHWGVLDLHALTPIQRAVLAVTADIPPGELRSYGDVARAIGRPLAYRFVGTTLARNPFPLLIPCHRVIRSDGSFGEFGGGRALKRWLIELDGICRGTS